MARTIILGKTPYRVLKRYRHSISLQPINTEYPHLILLRRSISDPSRSQWQDQWGLTRDGRVTWYQSPDGTTSSLLLETDPIKVPKSKQNLHESTRK